MNPHAAIALEYPQVRKMVLDRLQSAAGRHEACFWTPVKDPAAVADMLDETGQWLSLQKEAGGFDFALFAWPEEIINLARPEDAIIPPADLLIVRGICRGARLCRTHLLSAGKDYRLLINMARNMPRLDKLEAEINSVLDDEGEFLDHASGNMSRIRQGQRAVRQEVTLVLRSFFRKRGQGNIFQDEVIVSRSGRFVLMVKAQHKHRLEGVVLDRTDSGAGLYVEPKEAVPLNNRLMELLNEEEAEKKCLLRKLTKSVRDNSALLLEAAARGGRLDLIQARAVTAESNRGIKPIFSNMGQLRLVEARHPILDTLLKKEIVPMNLNLDSDQRILVITGPNTGGKTVALKTIGLFSLMAQSGLFVPADEGTELPLVEDIFADIGDEQSLTQNLSTFSAHVKNIAEALINADKNSLVILDELGAGTDPGEGSTLAVAILENLLDRRCLAIVSTHHGQLALYAARTPGVANASMSFDEDSLRPTFRLLAGVPGQSHARAVALRMGMPPEVVRRSVELQSELDREMAGLTRELRNQLQSIEIARNRVVEREKELAMLSRLRDEELANLKKRRREILDETKREADRLLSAAQREMKAVIAEAAEEKIVAQRRFAELKKSLARDLCCPDDQTVTIDTRFSIGQQVKIRASGKIGRVVSCDQERGRLSLDVEGKTVKAAFNKVVPLETCRPFEPECITVGYTIMKGDEAPEYRLDMRGMREDEAASAITRHLDWAWLSGAASVEIMHGKGLGRLKDLTARIATEHPGVERIAMAPDEQGGAGVTIVFFK